jgi:hypothetical protein
MKSLTAALCAVLFLLTWSAIGCGGGATNPTPGGPGGSTSDLFEDFLDALRLDAAATDADWGATESSILKGQPVSSRTVHVYGYPQTDNGVNSGRGQYTAHPGPLVGATWNQVVTNPVPATNLGRRVMLCFGDTVMGAAGLITGAAWGPAGNATTAAYYSDIKLRMGFQASDSLTLDSGFGGNYEGQPTLVYEGDYQVQQNSNVGDTPGHPTAQHVDGYQEGVGCGAGGHWNEPLFQNTGWYAWPAFTAPFAWDPGDPAVANDRVLLFDASVVEGDAHQLLRHWFAITYPCSGLLIGGYPRSRLYGIYEGTAANPQPNQSAGIVNPEPGVVDTRFTFTRGWSVAQSKFFAGPYGDDTDYRQVVLSPTHQSGNASVTVEFQGADSILADQVTIDTAQAYTQWVQDIDVCDGMRYVRFRITLFSDLQTLAPARLDSITIPTVDSNP